MRFDILPLNTFTLQSHVLLYCNLEYEITVRIDILLNAMQQNWMRNQLKKLSTEHFYQ